MGFVEVIARKRDGLPLKHDEIMRFVRGASDGSVPPEQLAALLMAICIRGMNAGETRWLTEAMLHSGEVWRLADDRPDAVDKHSTGGIGDTVSLILAPLLASIGVPVAMMAGHGLGHSQGTLDKLDAIPGFRTEWDRDGMLSLLDRCGAAVVAQSERIAPADRTLYALRDVTAEISSGIQHAGDRGLVQVIEDYYVKVLFVDSHLPAYTVEELKKSAEHLTHQKIARDKRIFAPRGEKK